jgi:hypothetical protein
MILKGEDAKEIGEIEISNAVLLETWEKQLRAILIRNGK